MRKKGFLLRVSACDLCVVDSTSCQQANAINIVFNIDNPYYMYIYSYLIYENWRACGCVTWTDGISNQREPKPKHISKFLRSSFFSFSFSFFAVILFFTFKFNQNFFAFGQCVATWMDDISNGSKLVPLGIRNVLVHSVCEIREESISKFIRLVSVSECDARHKYVHFCHSVFILLLLFSIFLTWELRLVFITPKLSFSRSLLLVYVWR